MRLSSLSRLTAYARLFPGLANFLLPIGLAVLTCAVAGGWLREHDRRVRDNANLTSTLARLTKHDEQMTDLYIAANKRAEHDGTAVVVAIDSVRVYRDSLVLAPVTRADTIKALVQFPEFVKRSDVAVARCEQLTISCAEARVSAANVIASLRGHIDTLERAKVYKPPRYIVHGDALYDPFRKVPMLAADAQVRIAGAWSGLARGEQRFEPGRGPTLYIGARVTP